MTTSDSAPQPSGRQRKRRRTASSALPAIDPSEQRPVPRPTPAPPTAAAAAADDSAMAAQHEQHEQDEQDEQEDKKKKAEAMGEEAAAATEQTETSVSSELESAAAAAEASEASDSDEDEKSEEAGETGEEEKQRGKRDKSTKQQRTQKKRKTRKRKQWSGPSVDVSSLEVDVTGVSFMLMGDVDRSLCEGLIYQHGGVVSKVVLKTKQQYVIAGATKRVHMGRGAITGPGTKVWLEAEQAGKRFMSQRQFERWMRRVQRAKDEAEDAAHSTDQHVVALLLEATSLPAVLIELIAEYAVDEAAILGVFRAWCKLEQRASDGAHSSTLAAAATEWQIADVEARLRTRLPFPLRQLLRLHNGVALEGDAAGMCVFPSTAELVHVRPRLDMFTLPLRWLPWQTELDFTRTPQQVQCMYFVPPLGPLVTTTAELGYKATLYAVGPSLHHFLQHYVDAWKDNIAAAQQQREEEKEVDVSGASASSNSQDEGSPASEEAAVDSPPLSSQARLVAACRPSALSVPCMTTRWPHLKDADARVWRQAELTQLRGERQYAMWRGELGLSWKHEPPAAADVVS